MDEVAIKILVFQIGEELYATDLMKVERILSYEKTTEIPDSPSFVEGVINYEESVLPIINIAEKFNLQSKEISDDTKIIVLKQKTKKFGFIVDLVSEVRDINSAMIQDTPDILGGVSKRYISGLINLNDRITIYLDLENILSEEEKLYF